MRVLLLGGGGREHAIGWKLRQSPQVGDLFLAPGNPGLDTLGTPIAGVTATDPSSVTEAAIDRAIDLVVVGPEAPLAAGVADALRGAGIPVFGPDRQAARLESSKAYAKTVMIEAGVPTAAAEAFWDRAAAIDHLRSKPAPYVVKADGLAAGKGVLVTEELAAAEAWVDRCIGGGFGEAGATVVIEDHLDGPEISVFAICDGSRAIGLQPARDYKRLGDGDVGPNTGGMGCFSPVDDIPDDLVPFTLTEVVAPVLEVMAGRGLPYVGFLYTGFVLTADGPKVLEFNCRLGDPETQVVLPRLESDLAVVLADAAAGRLGSDPLTWSDRAAVDVVLAADGYPESPRRGDAITGIDEVGDDVLVFHAGTALHGDQLVTAGGRVLNVVGTGQDVVSARNAAYAAADRIRFDGKQYRTDIAG